jgi:PAS domain S-box-containing protein
MTARRVRLDALRSLRVRVPLLICAVVVVVLAVFLGVAFREVEHTLVRSAEARARTAADQLAGLLIQSAQQRLSEMRRAADASAVRDFAQNPSDQNRAAARERLALLVVAGQAAAELWDNAGHRLLEVTSPSTDDAAVSSALSSIPPSTAGMSAFTATGTVVFYEAVAEIAGPPPVASELVAPAPRIGFVRTRRSFATSGTSDAITGLVGRGAVVLLGNQSADVWSDLTKVVPAPPVSLTAAGVRSYRAPDGDTRLGAVALISGTPWAVWVEFPYSAVVAPAWTFVARMLVIGLGFVVVTAIAARMLSARITKPLQDLTDAAEAIAAGEYSRRVAADSGHEIGRLGAAFNAMTTQVEESHRDLEERVEHRVRELTAAREELDRFFSLSLDMLCIAEGGYFKRVNPAWEDVLGWTAAELTAQPYSNFVHPDERAATAARLASIADGTITLTFENRYRHKDGTYRWLQWKAAPVAETGVIYAAARDVTEQKRAEGAMQEHAAALTAVNSELEAFSYSVSHDLRAPLRHVTGFASLLDKQAGHTLDAQGRRYLKTIIEAARHMGQLIDDLLAFSRMGRATLTKQSVDLGKLIERVRHDVMGDAADRDITWRVHSLPRVDADPAMLTLVLVNLLSNAVKYTSTRAHAEIEIGSFPTDSSETGIFVRDSGVGFDMQYVHKLFGVFQRLHGSDEFPGTGIGLANVRRIVLRHGGRVWAESQLDRGTTFYVVLPNNERSRITDGAPAVGDSAPREPGASDDTGVTGPVYSIRS